MKLLLSAGRATLYLQPAPDLPLGMLVEWLLPTGPRAIGFGSNRVVRADYDPANAAWQARFDGVGVDMIHLQPDGGASADLTGTRRALQDFALRLQEAGEVVDVRRVGPAREAGALLTSAQDHALREAVAAGYYRIPRPLNLHDLAAQMGVTAASLSERLRRAEGRVLTRYVELGSPSLGPVTCASCESKPAAPRRDLEWSASFHEPGLLVAYDHR